MNQFSAIVVGIAAVLAALGGIGVGVWKLVRVAGKVNDAYDAFVGAPAEPIFNKPEQPGVMPQLKTLNEKITQVASDVIRVDEGQKFIITQLDDHSQQLAKVDKELHPNGGSSLRDRVEQASLQLSHLTIQQARDTVQLVEIKKAVESSSE